MAALLRQKLTATETQELVKQFKKLRNPQELQIGDELIFYVANHNQNPVFDVARVDWKFSKDERITASKKIHLPQINTNDTTTQNLVSQPSKPEAGNLVSTYLLKDDLGYTWTAKAVQTQSTVSYSYFEGVIEDSLWASGQRAGLPSSHIAALADLFAWEIDFSREVRAGDKWKMVVEKINYLGRESRFGKIVATTYSKGERDYTAVRWEGDSVVRSGYFQPDGSSLRRMFLKSPIDFARISSGFSRARFHPILKVKRPHLGVDYAAKIGTPVKTIGDGRVTYIGYSKIAGKTIKIRHNSTYNTAYKHLNGYARKLRVGSNVEQGQVIGYVGTTGRSTGPHLHFELKKNKRIVDPLSEKFPTADPFPPQHLPEFKSKTKKYVELLKTKEREKVSTLGAPAKL